MSVLLGGDGFIGVDIENSLETGGIENRYQNLTESTIAQGFYHIVPKAGAYGVRTP